MARATFSLACKSQEEVALEPLKRVKVLEPYSVAHHGTAYWPNAVAEVPLSIADKWIKSRWVAEVTE